MAENDKSSTEFTFTIHPAGGGTQVPAWLLIQSVSILQELVQLFALKEENRTIRERLRLPEDFKKKYMLSCEPPKPGSFALSGRIAPPGDEWFVDEQAVRVMQSLQEFGRATVGQNQARLVELVPDSRLRHRILSSFAALSPAPGSGHRFELFNGTGPRILLEESLPARIAGLLKPQLPRAEAQTVTGRLEAISFSDRKVTINYAPRGRWLECIYEEDVEPMLLENRRDLIQVTGRVIADDDGHPKRIVEAEEIVELDLSPFVLGEVEGLGVRIKPKRPISLKPYLSDSEQLICLEHPNWELHVFAPTRSQLFEELKEQVLMLWAEYVAESDDVLAEPARELKKRLVADLEEVPIV